MVPIVALFSTKNKILKKMKCGCIGFMKPIVVGYITFCELPFETCMFRKFEISWQMVGEVTRASHCWYIQLTLL